MFYTIGTGDLRISVPNGESFTTVLLRNALHAPEMGTTIISISRITKAGYSVTFDASTCKIRNPSGKLIGIIPQSTNGLYKVEHVYAATVSPECVNLQMLHRQLAHIAPDGLHMLIGKGTVEGVQLINDRSPLLYDACEHAKFTHKPIQKERIAPIADAFGAEVHSDLWGASPLESQGGRKYYITFTDDHTCYTHLTMLCSKDKALAAYKSFAAWAHTQHGVRIKRLYSD